MASGYETYLELEQIAKIEELEAKVKKLKKKNRHLKEDIESYQNELLMQYEIVGRMIDACGPAGDEIYDMIMGELLSED